MAKILTEQQQLAIEWLARPNKGGKTLKEIAEIVGASERTIQRWRTDEQFVRAAGKRAIMLSQDRLPEMMAAAPEFFLKDGNAAMFREIMKVYGYVTEKVEIDQRTNSDRPTDMASVRAEIERLRAEQRAASDDADTGSTDAHDTVQ